LGRDREAGVNSVALTDPAPRTALAEHRPSICARAADLAPWIVDVTFPAFGLGPVVDLGCGDRTLAGAFTARGVPASIVDLTTGAHLSELEPVETAFLVHVLEWLATDDLARLLRQVRHVVGRDLFVVVDSRAGADVPRLREWWENQLLDAGFARHPLSLNLTSYESLEKEGDILLLAARRLPDTLLQRFPRESLLEERGLHMDMLREAGRRADAHLARYALASTFVRPRDRVLDAACGLGYGAAMLTEATLADSVVGIDSSPRAIEYARSAYGVSATFECRDVSNLVYMSAGSLDLIVSFETLEHIADPDSFLRESCRLLTPGGRFICSIPNRWVDESGRDPNPYHLHVFDQASILGLCGRYFRIERLFGQTAGGGMKASATARGWHEVTPASDDGSDPEWWVVVAMKDPLPEPSSTYREALSSHPAAGEWTVTAFERYYENPWVVRSLVSRGLRATSSSLLMALAREVFDRSTPFSADAGAALCVLAYAYAGSSAIPGWLTAALRSYCLAPEGNPHVERWRISNEYALARIELEAGHAPAARELFERCALRDCLRFSPLLGTKTIDAAFWAGWLAMQQRDTSGAGRWWTRGLEEAQRVLAGDWTNVIGSPEEPLLFGMRELTDVADLASRCASGLHLLTEFGDRPGVAAEQTWRSLGGLLHSRERELALTRQSMAAIEAALESERRWRIDVEAALGAAQDAERTRTAAHEAALEAERCRATDIEASLAADVSRRVAVEAALEASQADAQDMRRRLRTARALSIRLAVRDSRGVAIFGAGQGGRQVAAFWQEHGGHVACFVDNNRETWGTVVDDVSVRQPSTLETRDVALVIVASVAHVAIAEQLTRMGLVADRDFICWADVPGLDG
jgi:2-polyprenyl-3-methyl-5-hydroxy-6-metoxy-1,4-benzoquinol methylase